jgi:hypothetical protein
MKNRFMVFVVIAALCIGCGGGDDGGDNQFSSLKGADNFVDLGEWVSDSGDPNIFADFDADLDNQLSESEFASLSAAGDDYVACTPAGCDDGNSCTVETCEAGQCKNVVDFGASCDDGDICTTSEYCHDDGECRIEGDGGAGTEFCAFDSGQEGKSIGKHVKNFGMKTHEGCPYYLHQDCGTETKLIWMILSTGW